MTDNHILRELQNTNDALTKSKDKYTVRMTRPLERYHFN